MCFKEKTLQSRSVPRTSIVLKLWDIFSWLTLETTAIVPTFGTHNMFPFSRRRCTRGGEETLVAPTQSWSLAFIRTTMSALYSNYKAVGYVTDGNPFVVNTLGEETFITTSIGKSFQVYRTDRLAVCMVSKQVSEKINCLQVIGHETFLAVSNTIRVFNRAREVKVYEIHRSPVIAMITIGKVLLSFDLDNKISVVDTKQRECVGEIHLTSTASISSFLHPSTYLNKIIVGFTDGELELWNIKRKQIVYKFSSHIEYLKSVRQHGNDWTPPGITCMEQSPACDVVGLGFSNGDILLMQLKFDTVLFSFRQDSGTVTSLSFRTDVSADKFPFLASSSAAGIIYIWNLGTEASGDDTDDDDGDINGGGKRRLERKLERVIDDAHMASVSKLHFLHGEPVLISSSHDNSLKMWIFDAPDGSPRLLRSREGHGGHLLRIRYYGGVTNASLSDNAEATSCEIVSAGSDRTLRLFNTALEAQNREMSQKPVLKKLGLLRRNERLPVVTNFDFSETRERNWGNLVTIHRNHSDAYVWRFRHRVVTDVVLRQPRWPSNAMMHTLDHRNHASAVAVSPCGNFCAVGSKGGTIHLYNLQSGQPRGSFPPGMETTLLRADELAVAEMTPGNVFNMRKQLIDSGKGGQANSLKSLGPGRMSGAGVDGADAQTHDRDEGPALAGHAKEVTGIFVDMTRTILCSCGLDGNVLFWDFHTHNELARITRPTPLLRLQGFHDGGFVAVAGQDLSVTVYDVTARTLIRQFVGGHTRQVTDLAFTPDGRRLLSSSLDTCVRVWDLPTGRCISWLSFDAPVLTMAVSHSGEFLCVGQADKEGIYMYVDRSLYETVHFWTEPSKPTPVTDSMVQVESGPSSEGDDVDAEGDEAQGGDGDMDGDTDGEMHEEMKHLVQPSKAHVQIGDEEETTTRRVAAPLSKGLITMSTVPKAYWSTLFNLELIKERNKPIAPPQAPPQAPFFLPTVVREGSAPSFPTPDEFQKLVAKNVSAESGASSSTKRPGSQRSDGGGGDSNVNPSLGGDLVSVTSKAKRSKVDPAVKEDINDVVAELAQMGSSGAWSDDDDDEGEGGDGVVDMHAAGIVMEQGGEAKVKLGSRILNPMVATISEEGSAFGSILSTTKSKSRILKRISELPRCKLVAFLSDGKAHPRLWYSLSSRGRGGLAEDGGDPLLLYLSSLAPSAVDLELRALCQHDEDSVGHSYLRVLLEWFAEALNQGTSFELLQAYLHRVLLIYKKTIVTVAELGNATKALIVAHDSTCERFRHLVQSNLCLLKLLAGLPPT